MTLRFLGAFGVTLVLPPGFYKPVTPRFHDLQLNARGRLADRLRRLDQARVELPGVDLTNIAAYRQQQTVYSNNYASPITVDIPIVQNSKWYLYEELRAVSSGDGPFHFLGGATYLRDHTLGKTDQCAVSAPVLYSRPRRGRNRYLRAVH